MAGAKTCAEMNSAVDRQLSFASNFKAFAPEKFDSELKDLKTGDYDWPVDDGQLYQDLHGDFPEAMPKLDQGDNPPDAHREP